MLPNWLLWWCDECRVKEKAPKKNKIYFFPNRICIPVDRVRVVPIEWSRNSVIPLHSRYMAKMVGDCIENIWSKWEICVHYGIANAAVAAATAPAHQCFGSLFSLLFFIFRLRVYAVEQRANTRTIVTILPDKTKNCACSANVILCRHFAANKRALNKFNK